VVGGGRAPGPLVVHTEGDGMASDLMLVAAGCLIGVLIAAVYVLWWKARYTRALRRDAVARSEAVTTGKIAEQLVPLLPGFPFNPRDARFLGSPVDLVVFDGLAEGRVERVVLVEVKTGNGTLSSRERLVRDAVRAGRVEWLELRLDSRT
jgi:predicted Holliday junction resolvase-like endonuclease